MHSNKCNSLNNNLKFLGHTLCISLLLPTTSVLADATVECNIGSSNSSLECGVDSSTTGTRNTAIGYQSSATGSDDSTAIGERSTAGDTSATALGSESAANSYGSVSLGRRAGYNGGTDVIDSGRAIAIGHYSNIGAASPGAIAIGGRLAGNGTNNRGAEAIGAGAIAIGADVYNNVPNSMLINVPLRIEGASPSANALYLTANTIAIGTSSPAKTVHIVKSDGTAAMRIEENSGTVQKRYQMQLENNGPTGFKFTDNNNDSVWQFSQTPAGGFSFANTANGGQDFVMNNDGRVLMGPGPVTNFNLDPNGDLDIPNGSITANGILLTSSRASKTDISAIEPAEVMEKLKQVEIAEWRYKKADKNDRHISPMAEDFYSLFKLGPDNKHINPNDLASVAIIAAKELQKESATATVEIEKLSAANTKLREQLKQQESAFNQRLATLEKLVMNLASGQNTLPASGKQVVLNH